jgi:hypothetical protein
MSLTQCKLKHITNLLAPLAAANEDDDALSTSWFIIISIRIAV